jgi:hypothetical protein
MVNRSLTTPTLFTPSTQQHVALHVCMVLSKKSYTHRSTNRFLDTSTTEQNIKTTSMLAVTSRRYDIHLPSEREIKDHIGRTQARSTSAATNKQASLHPPSPQLPQRIADLRQGKERALPLVQEAPHAIIIPLAYSLRTIEKRSSTCTHIA